MLVCSGSALSTPARASQTETKLIATKDRNAVIGKLKWSVKEVATGKVLASGNRQIRLKDVTVFVRGSIGGGASYDKYISLGSGFALCRPETPEKSRSAVSGFGLTLERNGPPGSFSWEWFVVESSTRARKLQEGGRLGIRIAKTALGYELSRTDFLTDVSMRAQTVTDPPGSVRWRALISKGSSVVWPTVRNGKVVLK